MRGEYFSLNATPDIILGSPPLARGIRFKIILFTNSNRITPACAGNTLSGASGGAAYKDHPRLRGEYVLATVEIIEAEGSPPLARGIHSTIFAKFPVLRITPACAGNTAAKKGRLGKAQDHPRLRGEYSLSITLIPRSKGSPPLARGILYFVKIILMN